ncbi:hypothetical protein IKF32_02600 [Candidatus Saccharibacteria bacterium]|nr:hypothetical protein [Candidatus Saccharibacteria bacterium]
MKTNHKEQITNKQIANIATGSLLFITLLSGLVLASNSVSAEDVVDQINITVPVSCTLSGTGQGTHNETIENGTYESNIGTTTIKAFCNDNTGFAIYAAGYTGDEIGGTNSNKLVGASTNQTIVTGTATTAGNPDVSNWAMKLGTITSPTPTYPITITTGYNDYHTVPNEYTKVAYRNTSTDIGSSAEGATLTTTYAAYISKTQAADTYTGQVIYTLVHPVNEIPAQPQPSTPGYISYHANSNTALGTMGAQSAADGNTVTLLASNFSRTGYGFAGWSDAYDYATNPNANLYGPNEEITVPNGTTANGLSLYAIWIESAGSFQDSSKVAALCGAGAGSLIQASTDGTKTLASVSALTDSRDNQTYAIAKLADGKCWMIENLRLETAGSDNEALSQGFGKSTTYGNFSGLATAETADFSNSTTANSLYYSGTQSGTASINIGTTDNPPQRMPRYRNTNISSRASSPTDNTGAMYSYGNYYTWSAALANTIHYSGPTATDADGKTSETVNTSICPSGWRLPYGRDSGNGNTAGGFYYLNYKINNNSNVTDATAVQKLRVYPNNFIYSGYAYDNSINSRSSNGRYWSSTAEGIYSAYFLFFRSGVSVGPGTSNNEKRIGYSLRCVAGS